MASNRTENPGQDAERPIPGNHAGDGSFRRLLVVVDDSECGGVASDFAREWIRTFGGEMTCVTLEEGHGRTAGRHRPTLPEGGADGPRVVAAGRTLRARNRGLTQGIVRAAQAWGADVIVLGCDRGRLKSGHLCASLRDRLARATELPVMVAPAATDRRPAPRRPISEPATRAGEVGAENGRYAHV